MNDKAWQEGYDAYNEGLLPEDCPYRDGTEEYDRWFDGAITAWNEYVNKCMDEHYSLKMDGE